MRPRTAMKELLAGFCALALVIVGAAGCSESGGDRVGSAPDERAPAVSPPASPSTAPSGSASAPSSTPPGGSQEAAKPEAGAGGSTSGPATGSASPASPPTSPPASADPGQAEKPGRVRTEAPSGAATTERTAGATGRGSDRVMAIQEALVDEGHDPGEIDGWMGPRTRAALQAFQTAKGLQPTGRSDAATLEALGIEGKEGGG